MNRVLATEWKPRHDPRVGFLRLLKSEGLL